MQHQHRFTLGIEEEFQLVDPVTLELKAHIQEILDRKERSELLRDVLKPEMHQSVVETGTRVCGNIQEARLEIYKLRSELAALARDSKSRIAAAGSHPFSHWIDQPISEHPRYQALLQDMQLVGRANLIFGLHVHVGVDDRETALHILNAARYFLPHLLALSANSPFWVGRETGFKSYRIKVFDRFPRTGIPDYFSSLSEYDNFIALLVKTNCIDDGKRIWWDIRLHPTFNTLEFRICDVPMRAEETVAIAALCQAIVAKLYRLIRQNLGFRLYRRALIMENRWRASRYGLDGKLIDFGKQEEVPVRMLLAELVEFVDEVLDGLDSRREVAFVHQMMEMGTGADRQLAVWQATGDLRKVTDYIVRETEHGLEI